MTSNIITPSNTKAFCLKICKRHQTSLTPPLLLKCLYQAKELSSHVFVCWGVSIFSLSTIFLLDVGIVPTVWYICVFLYFGIVPTVWYIFVFLDFRIVPTVWYIFVFLDFRIVPTVWYIFAFLDFRIVPTVWYIFAFLDFRIVPTVWCIFVFLDFRIVLTVWYIFVFHFTTIRIRHSDVYLL
jgi:hypothetical protein